MTPVALIAANVFTVVSAITPGPYNTMLMASGVNFGLTLLVLCVRLGLRIFNITMALALVASLYPMLSV